MGCSTSSLLDKNVGFISNGTMALLRGLEAFRLAGSEEATLTFECLLDICPTPCDGFNCRPPPRIKRQIHRMNPHENEARVIGSWPVKVVDKKPKTGSLLVPLI
ncbi:uncharacterized protein LOC128250822 [Octopus bimaculoides]|uniref:uncharacterized protein LOC128250822 n=1 Tax=Octopus bimaculoides TaxID=37653 RepID=UPI0022E01B54|nr:uncharacterized protein LOC128250822 [Octopus bimaculoides]